MWHAPAGGGAAPLPQIRERRSYAAAALQRALATLAQHQPMNAASGSIHAAAWADASGRIGWVREDVGRHNALDKLIGALHHNEHAIDGGLLVISSRASYEMVSKAVRAGASVLAAVSAPTALAIDLARSAGLCLIGFARRADSMCTPIPIGCGRTGSGTPECDRAHAARPHTAQRSATFGKSTGTSNATLT